MRTGKKRKSEGRRLDPFQVLPALRIASLSGTRRGPLVVDATSSTQPLRGSGDRASRANSRRLNPLADQTQGDCCIVLVARPLLPLSFFSFFFPLFFFFSFSLHLSLAERRLIQQPRWMTEKGASLFPPKLSLRALFVAPDV